MRWVACGGKKGKNWYHHVMDSQTQNIFQGVIFWGSVPQFVLGWRFQKLRQPHLYHLNPIHISSYTMHLKSHLKQMTQLLLLWIVRIINLFFLRKLIP